MKKKRTKSAQFQRFDRMVSAVLSVSHDELKRREEKYKAERKARKRLKS